MPNDDSGLLTQPDEWFHDTFPDGRGFGRWVRESGYLPRAPLPDDPPGLQEAYAVQVEGDPVAAWERLDAAQQVQAQNDYLAWMLGSDSPPAPAGASEPPLVAEDAPLVTPAGLDVDSLLFPTLHLDQSAAGDETPDGDEPLPGLEPEYEDDPSDDDTEAPSERDSPSDSAPRAEPAPARWGSGEWTDQELQDWFEHEYGGDDQLTTDWERLPSPIQSEVLEDYGFQEETELERLTPDRERSDEARLSDAFLSGEGHFAGVHPSIKAQLRDFIESGVVPEPRFTDGYPGPSADEGYLASEDADNGDPTRLYAAPGGLDESVPADDPTDAATEEAQQLWDRARDGSGDGVVAGGGGRHILGMSIWRALVPIVAVVAAVAVAALIALSGGDDDSEVPASNGGSTDGGAVSTAAAGGTTATGVATTVAAGSCEVAHDRQLIVDLGSPGDAQPAIPADYTRGEASENGFPTPYLEWSELPPETTEIAILVQRLTRTRGAEYAANPELWWTANPSGIVVWKVTGLDASLLALPASSEADPLPAGAVERMHENGRLTLGDQVYEQKLWINTGEPHLFTVFALCDPPLAGTADDYKQPWLIQNAVGVGWFISSLDQ